MLRCSAHAKTSRPSPHEDFFDIPANGAPGFGWHPHSGIATVTVIHQGLEIQRIGNQLAAAGTFTRA
jgi:redox-sensitive bicupin YhaK (pirin superfamily)